MKIMCIGKLTPDSLAFCIAAQDAMNLPTSGLTSRILSQSTGEPSSHSGGSPQPKGGA